MLWGISAWNPWHGLPLGKLICYISIVHGNGDGDEDSCTRGWMGMGTIWKLVAGGDGDQSSGDGRGGYKYLSPCSSLFQMYVIWKWKMGSIYGAGFWSVCRGYIVSINHLSFTITVVVIVCLLLLSLLQFHTVGQHNRLLNTSQTVSWQTVLYVRQPDSLPPTKRKWIHPQRQVILTCNSWNIADHDVNVIFWSVYFTDDNGYLIYSMWVVIPVYSIVHKNFFGNSA